MGRLIFHKIIFKGGHLVFSEDRRLRAAPQIPHEIPAFLLLRIVLRQEIGLFHPLVDQIQQRLTGIGHPVDHQLLKGTILSHGDAAVVQQIGIRTFIHAPMAVDKLDVAVEQLAVLE